MADYRITEAPDKLKGQLFAIVRVDLFHDTSVAWNTRISVTSIVADGEAAEFEVRRLNALNAGKGCLYFASATRMKGIAVEATETQHVGELALA
jgi:hypothetical protein